jgi:DNA-binding NarL/FixJ family response regulator
VVADVVRELGVEAIATRLLSTNGFEIAAAVDTGPAFLQAIDARQPDVAVVDVRLPPTFTDEGLRAAIEARRRHPGFPLTPRERAVLALMAEGRANAAIARHLVITTKAVSKHIARIFAKLGLEQSDDDHRRVLAVLAYLNSAG